MAEASAPEADTGDLCGICQEIIREMVTFGRFLANKGLTWHFVHKICYYNVIFRKLDIFPVKVIPISTCDISGRGTINMSWVWPLLETDTVTRRAGLSAIAEPLVF